MKENFDWTEFEELLNDQHKFPVVYFFKFVVPNKPETVENVLALFEFDSEKSVKESSKGNFVSVSVKQRMNNAEEVIGIYKFAQSIEGVIAL